MGNFKNNLDQNQIDQQQVLENWDLFSSDFQHEFKSYLQLKESIQSILGVLTPSVPD